MGAAVRENDIEEGGDRYWFDPKAVADVSESVKRKLIGMVCICLLFVFVEAIGAYYAHSVAVLSDVAHLLCDALGFFVSIAAMSIARAKPTPTLTYGYVRAELLGALFSISLIWVLTSLILVEAVSRVVRRSYEEIDAAVMLATSAFGIAVNVVMGAYLHSGGGHCHAHCHAKHSEREWKALESEGKPPKMQSSTAIQKGDFSFIDERHTHCCDHKHEFVKKSAVEKAANCDEQRRNLSIVKLEESHNIRAARLHVLGDLLQSIGVFVVAGLIYFRPDWRVLDPLLSIAFALIALACSVPVTRDTLCALLDGVPPNFSTRRFAEELRALPDVVDVHELHVWQIGFGRPALTVHVVCEAGPEAVLRRATLAARRRGIYHSAVQVECRGSAFRVDCAHNVHGTL